MSRVRTEILLFDGYDDLDVAGPLEVLSSAGFDVTLVTCGQAATVTSVSGASAVPGGRLGQPGLLVVPGGGWLARAPAGAWAEARRGGIPAALKNVAAAGTTVAGVCTGAMLLARAGLLAGRPAITHHGALRDLAEAGAQLIDDVRVVDDGDVLTCGGITAGLDLALWLVEREQGREAAREHERRLEYRRGRVWCRHGGQPGAAGPREGLPQPAAGDAAARRELEGMFPATPLARATLEHVSGMEPAVLAHHSIRSYLFAGLAAGRRGLAAGRDYDDEVLFCACLLHDAGLTGAASPAERFEVAGADLATAFLRARGMDARRAELAWEAIALHTSAGIAERRGPETALAHAGIGMDFGRGTEAVPDGLAATIHAAYPRLDLARELTDAVVATARRDPRAAPPYCLADQLARERGVAPFVTRLELAAARGRWGS
jgi:putative intracellular protease/amidase